MLLALPLAVGELRTRRVDLTCEAMAELRHGLARSSRGVERALESRGERAASLQRPTRSSSSLLRRRDSTCASRASSRLAFGPARVVLGAPERALRLDEALLDDDRGRAVDPHQPGLRGARADAGLTLPEPLGVRALEGQLGDPRPQAIELGESGQRTPGARVRLEGVAPSGGELALVSALAGSTTASMASSAVDARAYSSRHAAAARLLGRGAVAPRRSPPGGRERAGAPRRRRADPGSARPGAPLACSSWRRA